MLRHVAPFGLSIILILCIVLTVHSAGALPHRHVPRAWVVGRQLHWGYASPARSSAAPSGHFPPAAPAAERASRGPEHVPRAHEDPLPVRYAAAPGRGPHVATGRRAAALGWGPLTGALAAVSAVGVAGYAWSRGRAAPRARPLRCRALCAAVDGLDWFEKEEVPYFAYGSNVNARVMRGLRGIDAARQDNGVVADHRLGFTLLGYSLVEPSWASCEPSAGTPPRPLPQLRFAHATLSRGPCGAVLFGAPKLRRWQFPCHPLKVTSPPTITTRAQINRSTRSRPSTGCPRIHCVPLGAGSGTRNQPNMDLR